MNIAIFADLHGRLLLCFKLCARWERETGQKIDLILQAGDLGAYPDISRLDRATIKHAREDPTELGFSNDFVTHRDEVAAILVRTSCPMIFVRGNHEDHVWLDNLEKANDAPIFPVDVYERVYCLKTGIPYTFQKEDETITVLGIGRIGPLPGEQDETKDKYIQPYELQRLYGKGDLNCDVLLTHDTALDFISLNYGMEEIRLVLDAYTPIFHFHGHVGGAMTNCQDDNGQTRTIKMADLHFDKSTPQLSVQYGSMGILHWQNRDNHSFTVIEDKWFEEYNAKSWANID